MAPSWAGKYQAYDIHSLLLPRLREQTGRTLPWCQTSLCWAAGNGGSPSPRAPRQAPAKVRIPRPPPAPASPRDAPSQPPPELGEYASGRPRRHTKTPGYRLGSSVEDEHQMVEPEHYRGIPGSGAPDAQPFRIEVTPTAQVSTLILCRHDSC